MKVVYINGRFLSQNITGVQRYAEELTKAIDKILYKNKEYTFILLVPKNIKRTPKLKNIKIKQIGFLKGHLWEQIELPIYSNNKLLINFCGCAPIIKQNQFVTIHDAAVCVMPQSFSFLFRNWYKIMFFLLGKRARKIFTVSNFSKDELNRYFKIRKEKIFLTYNGINHINKIKADNNIFNKFNIEDKKYIFAVSSLNPSKNFKLVLKAAADKRLKNKTFIIAGGSNRNVFKDINLNIPNNVRFIGYVTDEELVSLYKHANCFVFPSIYEGFGIPPTEAMVCGCPVIVSNIGVLPEICKNGALYCKYDDSNSLVEKIIMIYNNDSLRNILVKNGKEVVKNYDWNIAAKEIIKLS